MSNDFGSSCPALERDPHAALEPGAREQAAGDPGAVGVGPDLTAHDDDGPLVDPGDRVLGAHAGLQRGHRDAHVDRNPPIGPDVLEHEHQHLCTPPLGARERHGGAVDQDRPAGEPVTLSNSDSYVRHAVTGMTGLDACVMSTRSVGRGHDLTAGVGLGWHAADRWAHEAERGRRMDQVLLDDEVAAALAEMPPLVFNPDTVKLMRETGLAAPAQLSDAVERTDHVVSEDPRVVVRVHRAKARDRHAAVPLLDPRRRLRDRHLRHGRRQVRPAGA